MRNNKIMKRRKLVAGHGFVDTIYQYGKDGLQQVKKSLIGGVRHYAKAGVHYGMKHAANKAHELIDRLQISGNNKADQIIGSGVNTNHPRIYGRPVERSLILREMQTSLNTKGHKRKIL